MGRCQQRRHRHVRRGRVGTGGSLPAAHGHQRLGHGARVQGVSSVDQGIQRYVQLVPYSSLSYECRIRKVGQLVGSVFSIQVALNTDREDHFEDTH